MPQIPSWEIVAGALALITAFWQRVRTALAWLSGIAFATRRCDYNTGAIVLAYLQAHGGDRFGTRGATAYGGARTFIRPLDRVARVFFRVLWATPRVLWLGRRPIWFNSISISGDENNSAHRDYPHRFSFLRGTVDWEALLGDVAAWEDDVLSGDGRKRARFTVKHHHGTLATSMRIPKGERPATIAGLGEGGGDDEEEMVVHSNSIGAPSLGYHPVKWSLDDIRQPAPVSSLEQLSLPPEVLAVIEEIRFWHGSKTWYLERGIPWRRGYAFHGGPGTGKTSTARAVAQALDVPIHVFDMSSMTNADFRGSWKKMLANGPCMALLEDLDAVFDGRQNVAADAGGMTFDCLLNCIDGVERVDGMLLIVTTNNLDRLDPALVDRPGRVDALVEFKPLDHEGKLKMATRILQEPGLVARVVQEGLNESAAQFQERCFRAALSSRFEEGPFR